MVVSVTQYLPLLCWFTLRLWKTRGFAVALLPHLYLFGAYEIVQRYLPKNFFVLNLTLIKSRNAYSSSTARLVANAEAIAAVGGASVEEGACRRGVFPGVSSSFLFFFFFLLLRLLSGLSLRVCCDFFFFSLWI